MKRVKLFLLGVTFALMLFLPFSAGVRTVRAASSRSAALYKARAKKVKKNLPKKVKKLLAKGYYRPSCRVTSTKRKSATMYCNLQGAIGGGAYMIKVKVNLKTGWARVVENMVSIPTKFKVSMK